MLHGQLRVLNGRFEVAQPPEAEPEHRMREARYLGMVAALQEDERFVAEHLTRILLSLPVLAVSDLGQ
ncbi:hypothetical protein D3C73_1622740 [compost metagenome]